MPHISRTRLLIAASVLGLAAAHPALAQDTSVEELIVTAQKANQTEVTRGGRLGVLGDKAAEDTPFSIRSYNAALILNQQPQTLGQVLENDPSIRTTYGFGNAAEQFVIRGFVLNGDDVGLDGLYGLAPRQLVAPELYESVQVLNGASAFLNGAAPGGSAIGGSVNLLPKRAGAGDLARFTAGYTSDAHVGASFDVARRFGEGGEFGVRVNGAARGGDVSIDDEFRSTYVLGGAFDYRGETVRLSADLAYQRVKVRRLRPKVQLGGLTVIPKVPSSDANYAQDFTYTTLRDVFGVVKAEWDVSENTMLYVSAGARDGSEDGVYDSITVTNATTGAATGGALFVPRTDNNEAAQAGVRLRGTTGAVTHEVNAGGSVLWQVNRNAYDFLGGFAGFPTNLYATPQIPRPGTGFVGGDLDDPDPVSRTRLRSLFVSDTLGFLDDRLLVTAGLRWQEIELRSYDYFTTLRTSRYRSDALTPVVGVVFKPAEGVSLFANRVEGLVQGGVAPVSGTDPVTGGTLPVSNANETLSPFKSTQYELGAKWRIGRMNASVAVFQTRQPRSYTAPDPSTPGFLRFDSFGEQRNRGIELSVDGEVARGLRVIAGASILDAELRDTGVPAQDGNKAPGVPDYLLNANVEWDLPAIPALTLTGRIVHTGEQQVNAANTLQIPDWTRLDLGVRYVAVLADRPVTLRFNIDNVTNEKYWASAFDQFVPQLLQGAPRTYKLSASVDF
ncbi:TonB-dependent receptor [Phenylobacterium sp.]|uniref:TonB-dependent receptor n=1 Tax=Phenylobacterium sp. TaxID=1871053 RepID=UPI00301CE6AE